MITLSNSEQKEAIEFRKNLLKDNPDHFVTKSEIEHFPGDEAIKILEEEDPLMFLLKSIANIHVGDESIVAWHIFSGISSGFEDRKTLMHLAVVGNSGKGKSSVQDHVGQIFDNIQVVTSSSAKSQFYKAQTPEFPHKGIVRFDEAEGSEEGLILERALTDKSETIPTHDTVNKNKEYTKLSIPQINASWRNSVDPSKDEQVMNRYTLLNVNESKEQDKKVASKQIEQFCYDKDVKNKDIGICKEIIRKVKDSKTKIIIPYGNSIISSDCANRRSLPKFINLIKTITYLYRFQRTSINGYYHSTRKDFEIAEILWEKTAQLEKTHTNSAQQTVLEILPFEEEKAMERKHIAKLMEKGISSIHNYLTALMGNGLVSYKEIFDGTKKKLYWKVRDCQRVSYSIDWGKIKAEETYELIEHTVNNKEDFDYYKFHMDVLGDCISSEMLTLLKET